MTAAVLACVGLLLGGGGAWGYLTFWVERRDRQEDKPATDARLYLQDTESITLSFDRSLKAAERRAVAAEKSAEFNERRAVAAETRAEHLAKNYDALLETLDRLRQQNSDMAVEMDEMRDEIYALRGTRPDPEGTDV